ncbi:MAG: group III truncated hemoglobin [Phycisphaerales bacterium]
MENDRDTADIRLPLAASASTSEAQRITPEVIASIVERFYAACRKDPTLGPVFEAHVDDWDDHLARIRAFWGAALLRDGGYSGRPLEAHLAIPNLGREHFSAWLRLFLETVEEHRPPLTDTDVEMFRTRTGRMANRILAAAKNGE